MKVHIPNIIFIFVACMFCNKLTTAVKTSDFKTCSQSGFCQRNRDFANVVEATVNYNSKYKVEKSSLVISPEKGTISASISHSEDKNVNLVLEITTLEGDKARIKINEKAPIKRRYDELESLVLVENPKTKPFSVDENTENELIITFGEQNRLSLQLQPFKVSTERNGVPLVEFNRRGMFNFEYLRKKNENKLTMQEKEDSIVDLQEPSTFWEETFNGHQDSKPNGPSSIGMDITFRHSSDVYGIPEHASSLSLKTTRGVGSEYVEPYRLYNFDVFEHDQNSPMALYGSIPFMTSHKQLGSTGVFWMNSAEMWIDIEKSTLEGDQEESTHTHWMVESGVLDIFIFYGPTPKKVLEEYGSLTGYQSLPQFFAIAYHQCRWNYKDQEDVRKVDFNFDSHDIPYDVLWLDIEHTDGKRYFTWDSHKFQDPIQMQKNLAVKGRKMVTIIDPHIKADANFHVFSEASKQDLMVKNKDSKPFEGSCWPGSSSWIDYLNPAGREYWANLFDFDKYKGSYETLYTWNDMNEPSVFSGPEITMPKDNIHFGGWEHRDVHNIYGMLQQRSTYEGQLKRMPKVKKRPFVLSRAFFAGTQRYGPIWTGDNMAQWDHLELSTPMLLTIGLSGLPFCGADVGGFFNNPDADLLTRWYQTGAFQPFFRGHSHIETKRREPWLMGEPYTTYIREAIRQRYRHLPLWYTLFYEASISGVPPMRPLFMEYPEDKETYKMENEFMVGSSILVKPVVKTGETIMPMYLPGRGEIWYDYESLSLATKTSPISGTVNLSIERIPLFLRGGSIVPRYERIRRSASLMLGDPIHLMIALDAEGNANGTYYLDDGETFEYQRGNYIYQQLNFEQWRLTCQPHAESKGTFTTTTRVEKVTLLVPDISLAKGKQIASVKVTENNKGKTTTTTVQSLLSTFQDNQGRIVIKDPKVNMANTWTIEISWN